MGHLLFLAGGYSCSWMVTNDPGVTPPPHRGRVSGTQGQRWWVLLLLGTAGPPSPGLSELLGSPWENWRMNPTAYMITSSNGSISELLALCAENSPVTGEFPSQRSVTRSLDVFFHMHLNKRLNKQSWSWWFETPSPSLWRHCNEICYLRCVVYTVAGRPIEQPREKHSRYN